VTRGRVVVVEKNGSPRRVAQHIQIGERLAAAAGAPAQLPPALLQRRLDKANTDADKAKSDADKAIKENEVMQKQMNDMQAALALAKSNVGDVVQPTPTSLAQGILGSA
jgi:hypothetical protein